ncbi:MAG: methyltransferase domain-containing protein [Acidobacteriaceae bacterium]|nr:methyltransferase domain-containing protein [Acidobacteriaceae bacterium]
MPNHTQEWDAAAYHRVSSPQLSWGKKVLATLQLRGDEVVMDAGCGSGRLIAELLESLPKGRVVGIDLSQNMLATAHDHLRSQFSTRAQFVAADLQDLPFEHVFDGIFSTAAFHWVPDHLRLFRNLFRALRPGGWLRAQCGGGPNLARLRTRMNALMTSLKYARFFAQFRSPWVFNDAESAADLMRQAGFLEVETRLEPALTVFEDSEAYSEFVRTVILRVHLQKIPDAALRHEFVAELACQAAQDDQPFSLDYWRLNLSGRVPKTRCSSSGS